MPQFTENQVPSEEQDLVSTTPETQIPAGQAAPAALTPAPQTDAEVQALKAQLQKYEQDVRNLKSMSDKKLHEANQQWQQTEKELRHQLEETKLATMDEEARAKYLQQVERNRLAEMETKVSEAGRIENDYKASLDAIKHFTSLGVPLSELVLDQGYDSLFQSGYAFVAEGYKKANSPAAASTLPPLPPQAPEVAKTNGTVPNLKPNWESLIKTYGSAEEVFRLVEVGRLDPTIIPDN